MPSPVVLRVRHTTPRLVAVLAALVGVFDLAAVVAPRANARLAFLHEIVPGAVRSATAGVSVAVAMLLFVIASGLSRRKRRAWRLAVALVAMMLVLQVLQGDRLVLVGSASLLIVLGIARHEFVGQGDPRTRWYSLRIFVLLLLSSLVVGWLGASLVIARVHIGGITLWSQLRYVALGLAGVLTPLTEPENRTSDVFYWALLALGIMTAAVTAYLVLRSPTPRPRLTPTDEVAVRALLARRGDEDSLGYFAIRDDKSLIWSPSGKACISYRVIGGTMLASGDPLGDPDAWPPAIESFLALAREHAWVPAAVACSERGAQEWVRCSGLSALEFGDEALVDPNTFDLEGRAMRNVRQMTARVTRAGYVCRTQTLDLLPDDELAALQRLVVRWRRGDTERGFSMALGRLDAGRDPACVVVTASRENEVHGVIVMVPWGTNGLSLDLMRRSEDADPGVNELMIVELLRWAATQGICRVSLNFAVFREALERAERIGAGPVTRAWGRVLLFASRWAQIETLYRFNAKFQPEWQPRFIVYPGAVGLPRVVVAYLRAEAFLVRPRLGSHTRPRRRHQLPTPV